MNMLDRNGHLRRQTHAALVVAKKDVMIYYLKAPVLIFGVVFPVFFFLAFAIGRPVPIGGIVPGMLAMALFFTSSAIGPLVTPWERQAKTYERLVTSPASIEAILSGDVLAGSAFGLAFSMVTLIIGAAATDACIVAAAQLVMGLLLGALVFAALGVLLAAPVTTAPSQIMMLSAMVRLPLIFISGIFIPIGRMPVWARWLAPLSPLSYCTDLVRRGFGCPGYFPVWLDILALVVFTAVFFGMARLFHLRSRRAGNT